MSDTVLCPCVTHGRPMCGRADCWHFGPNSSDCDLCHRTGKVADSAGPAVPPAAEPTMPEGVWRCFHCDEVFTDVDAASEHFGANEFHDATCVLMQKGVEFLAATIRDLEARNRELLHRAVEAETDAEGYVGLRAELERYFGSSSAWICWNRMDEKQGRIEALEEQCAALRAEHERTLGALREAQQDVARMNWLEGQGQISIYFIERAGKQFNPASQRVRAAIDNELRLDASWQAWRQSHGSPDAVR